MLVNCKSKEPKASPKKPHRALAAVKASKHQRLALAALQLNAGAGGNGKVATALVAMAVTMATAMAMLNQTRRQLKP